MKFPVNKELRNTSFFSVFFFVDATLRLQKVLNAFSRLCDGHFIFPWICLSIIIKLDTWSKKK